MGANNNRNYSFNRSSIDVIYYSMEIMHFRTFLLIVTTLSPFLCQDLVVSMINQTNFAQPVTFISTDPAGHYWVCFNNGQYRKYSDDFSTVQFHSIAMAIQSHYRHFFYSIFTLTNGTVFVMTQESSIFEGDTHSKVMVRDFNTHADLDTHSFPAGPILAFWMEPLVVSGVSKTFLLAVLPNAVQLSYDGATHTIDSSTITSAMVGGELYAAYNYQTSSTNNYVFEMHFLISTSTWVYRASFYLTFTFNHGLNHFDYISHTSTITVLFWPPSTLIFFEQAGDIVYMEDAGASSPYVYYKPDNAASGMAPFSLGNSTSQFFQYNGDYYGFHQNGLAKLNFNTATKAIQVNNLTSPLPRSSYRVALSNNSTVLYEPGTPTIYVQVESPTPIQLTTAQPAQATTTFVPFFSDPSLRNAFDILMSIMQVTASAPAGRRVFSPFFYFFGVFDDLFLFQFHDRAYGNTMKQVFAQINLVEYAKWSLVDYQSFLKLCGISIQGYHNFTEYQNDYHTHNFTTNNHTNVEPEGLIANCHNFFMVALPITVATFFILKSLFCLTYNYPISQVVRKFYFVAFLLILLFDGNIQEFSFYLASEWQNLFFFTLSQKMIKTTLLFFGFFLCLGSCCFYFLCFILYGKLNRVIMDNNCNQLRGHLILIAQLGLRNFVLGILNSILRLVAYQYMLTVLIAVDLMFLSLFTASIMFSIYRFYLKMWTYVILDFLKIMIAFTLLADYRSPNNDSIEAVQQTILLVQLIVFLSGIVIELIAVIKDVLTFVRRLLCKENSTQSKIINNQLGLLRGSKASSSIDHKRRINVHQLYSKPVKSKQKMKKSNFVIMTKQTASLQQHRIESKQTKEKKNVTLPKTNHKVMIADNKSRENHSLRHRDKLKASKRGLIK